MAIPDSDRCREIAVTQVTGLASRFRVTCENGLSMAMGWTPQLEGARGRVRSGAWRGELDKADGNRRILRNVMLASARRCIRLGRCSWALAAFATPTAGAPELFIQKDSIWPWVHTVHTKTMLLL